MAVKIKKERKKDAAIQLSAYREHYISRGNYEITVVILWRRLIFPDWNYKDGRMISLFPSLKYS